jgi:nitrite reductase/ring-hydroxylating ferredoxin subunit
MLTDLPIGFWTSAWALDLLGPRRHRDAARVLVGLGVLSALPAAASGASDWVDTTGRAQRVGVVHAAANASALACYAASWIARRRGHPGRGIALGMLGAAAATVGGYLGGHLTLGLGVGSDAARVPEDVLSEWTRAVDESAVTETPLRLTVDGVDLVVFRPDGRLVAMGAVCPHRGGPLDEGPIVAGCLECPWHGSRFRIDDGAIVRGPAANPLVPFVARPDGVGGVEVMRGRTS